MDGAKRTYIIVSGNADLGDAVRDFYKDISKIDFVEKPVIEYINHIPNGVLPLKEH